MLSKNTKSTSKIWFSNSQTKISKNNLINLYARDIGIFSPLALIRKTNNSILDEIKLSKSRCIPSLRYSINWLDLDNVENRFMLAAKSDGNVIGIDMFQEQDKQKNLKILFNSSNSRESHEYSVSCVQWYPIDSGMFFTSSMDQKFKVWDTNNLTVVDEYSLNCKIYNHEISAVLSSNAKTLIALAIQNGQIRFIDLNSGSFTHTIKAHHQSYCVAARWSPKDPNLLCSAGSDGRIGLWDIRSSKSCLMYLDYEKNKNEKNKANSKLSYNSVSITTKCVAHTNPIISLTYSKDGNYIISLGKDNALRLWDSSDGLNTLVNYGKIQLDKAVAESCLQIACTEFCNPEYVYVPSGNNLLMFNMLDGELKKTYKGHFEAINCCYYNSQLNEFYTGSKDRNILIWSYEKPFLNDDSNCSIRSSKTTYSLLSNTGRNKDTLIKLNSNQSSISNYSESNESIVRTAVKRQLDNWSDDDE